MKFAVGDKVVVTDSPNPDMDGKEGIVVLAFTDMDASFDDVNVPEGLRVLIKLQASQYKGGVDENHPIYKVSLDGFEKEQMIPEVSLESVPEQPEPIIRC